MITEPIVLNKTVAAGNSLLAELVAVQKANVIASGNTGAIDQMYNSLVNAASTVTEVNTLFVQWWHANWQDGVTTRNALLARWFGAVLDDNLVHGEREPLFGSSETAIGALTDDSAGWTCTPSTEAAAGNDPFAHHAQFWTLEVAADKNADGTHTFYAVEFIDSYEDVRESKHLCWVLQKNTFTREFLQDGYKCIKMQCHPATGYEQWPQGVDKQGTVYPYMANPKYFAGLDADGVIGCGSNRAPQVWTSHSAGVTLWRKRGAQYSGASGNLLKWQLAMMRLKYSRKGNSGTIEGCTSYDLRYTAAVGEVGAERVLLTPAQAANLFVGSNIILGTNASTDRNAASSYSLCKCKRIKSIDSVTISGVTYAAVNIDNGGVTFDTIAGTTTIFTMPYWSGWNDTVQGYDGSRYSPTSGKEPGLIQRTEFQIGAYLIVSDELWQWGQDADGNYTFDCYTCHDQSKADGGSITANYTKQTDLTLTFPAGSTSGWRYTEDMAIAKDRAVLWPASVSTKAGSGTGCKAGFYVGLAASGVCAAWCCGTLSNRGGGGLPARASNVSTGYGNWDGGVGVPGLAG